MTIVLIDDDEVEILFFRRLLRKLGAAAELRAFSDAASALEALRAGLAADLILCDLNLPVMSGFDFADARHADRLACGGAPIILFTGSDDPADERRAAAHPAIAGFLRKPATAESVAALIGRCRVAPGALDSPDARPPAP